MVDADSSVSSETINSARYLAAGHPDLKTEREILRGVCDNGTTGEPWCFAGHMR